MDNDNIQVLARIEKARSLYNKFSARILVLPGFDALLKGYREEIEKSRTVMSDLGLPAICTNCAVSIPGGGCCGPAVATWYDPVTLFLNILFHVEFPMEPYYPDSCLFLGRDGCLLLARYHFCVNYLCSRITDRLSPGELLRLTSQSGRELYAAWRLEGMIISFLRDCHEEQNYLG